MDQAATSVADALLVAFVVAFWGILLWRTVVRWRRGQWVLIPLIALPLVRLVHEARFARAWLAFLARERQAENRRERVRDFLAAAKLIRPRTKRIEQDRTVLRLGH